MNYEQAKSHKRDLNILVEEASKKLQRFEKNELGLVPNHIRETEEYQNAKEKYEMLFDTLRKFNTWFMKEFKKEYARDRRNKYVAK